MILLAIFLNSIFRFFYTDEFEAIHTAWKILQGEKIYVDFFQHHHPLLYLLLIPFIYIFGESITAILIIRILFFLHLV